MYYSDIHNYDVANGPGIRVTLFVSGCPHHCIYCFNKETWDYKYGREFTQKDMEYILDLMRMPSIRGFTLLGGEPFAPPNQECCARILKRVKEEFPNKDTWCFTGYLYERDIISSMSKTYQSTNEMLKYIDVLVDGPFLQKYKNPSLLFKGSENQKTIDIKESIKQGREVLLDGFNDNLINISYEEILKIKEEEIRNYKEE